MWSQKKYPREETSHPSWSQIRLQLTPNFRPEEDVAKEIQRHPEMTRYLSKKKVMQSYHDKGAYFDWTAKVTPFDCKILLPCSKNITRIAIDKVTPHLFGLARSSL